jgi:hypothetical protein
VPFAPPDYLTGAQLPDRLLSASSDMTLVEPRTWALEWVDVTDETRLDALTRLGISAEHLDDVITWVTQAQLSGRWKWPGLFDSLESARAFADRFTPMSSPVIVGLGVRSSMRDEILSDHPDFPGRATAGFVEVLREGSALSEGGTTLGHEILGEEAGGGFHSWLCFNLEPLVRSALGVVVNEHGLISDWHEAIRAADLIRTEGSGAPPIPWQPWLLVEY